MKYLTDVQFDRLCRLVSDVKCQNDEITDSSNDYDDLFSISEEIENYCDEISSILDIAENSQNLKVGQKLEVV